MPSKLLPERPKDHSIDIVPGNGPPNKPPYRVVSAAQQEEIWSHVQDLFGRRAQLIYVLFSKTVCTEKGWLMAILVIKWANSAWRLILQAMQFLGSHLLLSYTSQHNHSVPQTLAILNLGKSPRCPTTYATNKNSDRLIPNKQQALTQLSKMEGTTRECTYPSIPQVHLSFHWSPTMQVTTQFTSNSSNPNSNKYHTVVDHQFFKKKEVQFITSW